MSLFLSLHPKQGLFFFSLSLELKSLAEEKKKPIYCDLYSSSILLRISLESYKKKKYEKKYTKRLQQTLSEAAWSIRQHWQTLSEFPPCEWILKKKKKIITPQKSIICAVCWKSESRQSIFKVDQSQGLFLQSPWRRDSLTNKGSWWWWWWCIHTAPRLRLSLDTHVTVRSFIRRHVLSFSPSYVCFTCSTCERVTNVTFMLRINCLEALSKASLK